MNATATISGPALSHGQKEALLKLLGDEDPMVFHSIRNTILAQGPAAVDWVKWYVLSDDPAIRRRARSIVLHFQRQEADNEFLAFCLKHGQEFDLEHGAWLLARTRYPDINVEGYRALLDVYARELRARMESASDPHHSLLVLNQFCFEELGFAGNEENYYDPDNSYLNKVLDRRTGNPINLCLVYLVLARRLQLPVTGIGLPGHFICRFQSSSAELYIDPFNRGKLLSKADCVQFLLQGNYSLREEYLSPVSPRRIMLRICGNLHQIYLHLDDEAESTRLQRYLVSLAT
ncbi:MAG TPA: transglutaminase-like domain-containing protein [Clostridia bacterium]|nr:transglutaminase-like domain-containing protein [Clostridia bacterium]